MGGGSEFREARGPSHGRLTRFDAIATQDAMLSLVASIAGARETKNRQKVSKLVSPVMRFSVLRPDSSRPAGACLPAWWRWR